MEDDIIRQYVDRVLAVSKRDEKLSAGELEEIARDIGLGDLDIEAVDKHIADTRSRAANFMERELYDDAIRELHDVEVFRPDDVENLQSLCSAYGGRFSVNGDEPDRVEARRIAKRVLTLDPEKDDVYALLSRLEKGFNQTDAPLVVAENAPSDQEQNRRKITLVLLILLSLGFISASGFWLTTSKTVPAELVSAEPVVSTPVSVAKSIGEFPIDVLPLPDGVDVVVEKSKFDVYPTSSFYKFSGFLVSDGTQELAKVNARFTYTLEDGNSFVRDVKALDTHEIALRPGDRKPFSELNQVAGSALKSISLQVTVEESLKGVGGYAPSKPIALTWDVDQAGFDLDVKERKFAVSNTMGDWHSSNIEWEITNLGPRPIKTLKLKSKLMSKDGAVLDETSHIVTFSSQPPIVVNGTRLDNDRYMSSEGAAPATYELIVEEIE